MTPANPSAEHRYVMFKMPEKSEWRCHLVSGVIFTPDKGNEPNRFHRWMQRLAFGIKWEKV